jgi:hypothetical protein
MYLVNGEPLVVGNKYLDDKFYYDGIGLVPLFTWPSDPEKQDQILKNRPLKWDGRRVFSPNVILPLQNKFDAKIEECLNAFESECCTLTDNEYGIAIFLTKKNTKDMNYLKSRKSQVIFPLRKLFIDALMWERASYLLSRSKPLSFDSKKFPRKPFTKQVCFDRGVLCHGTEEVYEYNFPIALPFDIGLMPDGEIYPKPKIIKVYCIDSECEITQIDDGDIYWSAGMFYSEGEEEYRFEGYSFDDTSLSIKQSIYKERDRLSAKFLFSSKSLPTEHYERWRWWPPMR